MSGAVAIAVGAVSALGTGRNAYRAAVAGAPARCAVGRDEELAGAGLTRPIAGRAPGDLGGTPSGDRATDLLAFALRQAIDELAAVRPAWRSERVGIALGTSSGGMLSAERFFASRAAGATSPEMARAATYFAPFDDALALVELGQTTGPRTQVLAACAASSIAIGIAARWLEAGRCDLVLAGGYDGLSVFVAAGFEALKATTATEVRPFRSGRDGMCLGEGAGVVALVRAEDVGSAPAHFCVAGFGASTDAVHITAPDRTGGGLARAARAALADAAVAGDRVGLVSAHATATPYNDAMEAKAIAAALGTSPGSSGPPVHPFKAQIGHTLGAAGVLELLAAADAIAAGVAPAAAGNGELDPDAPALLLPRGEARWIDAALKLSAAFGGANAALVLAPPSDRPARVRREVVVVAHAHVEDVDLVDLSTATGVARDRLARLDPLCRLGLAAVAALAERVGREALRGAGIVAGHGLATLDTNDAFDARRRDRGARWVDPRAFPATSPNAVGGECAIVYALTGPSFAVSAGLDGATEALVRAAELCADGDAERVVVVAADSVGAATLDLVRAAGWQDRPLSRGAVAVLLEGVPQGERRLGPRVETTLEPDHRAGGIGHAPLLDWLRRAAPSS